MNYEQLEGIAQEHADAIKAKLGAEANVIVMVSDPAGSTVHISLVFRGDAFGTERLLKHGRQIIDRKLYGIGGR